MKKRKGDWWVYLFIIIGILLITKVTVEALVPGVVPVPGHDINEFAPPLGCLAGQFLKYDGTKLICSWLS